MTEMNTVDPVKVHLVGSDLPLAQHREPVRPRRGVSLRTFKITSSDPIQQILPLNTFRCEAYVQALDNDVTLYATRADAQAGGGGGITVPKANTAPYPLHTTDAVWATAATTPTTICVTAIIEGP